MPDTRLDFNSYDRKRLVLIVDDEAINREILGSILEERFNIIYASTGLQALELMREHHDTLSLALLDLLMPEMNGRDVLLQMKTDERLSKIPAIVITSDKEAEVESLALGAIDFIPKPYPEPRVIMARVLRTIELSEDRDILRWTERDSLTGLYNREFFYRYAEQFDLHHKDTLMDAIVVDINHFHMINERYGKSYGDDVLKRAGQKIKDIVRSSGGIACRREADTFLIYCPHRSDYTSILENASTGLAGDARADSRVRLRMGIYSDVDKSIDIERRFDRAKMAADTVRNNFTRAIALYDNALHESEIFAEQLLEDFPRALENKEFVVYYQPKFDIRHSEPLLASAEALVRWNHPELGLVSPGIFIPLFEGNGLIQELDNYVWREAASQIREWKDKYGFALPVSINVSRIDMYDPALISTLVSLTEENGITASELLLEITESAYTQDSEQIIDTVSKLRDLGFKVEMDDFGTGYSSLNMISTLPIDALKLDMQFIRNAFSERRDTRMLEVIIDIADSLGVPTIAEGVETAEQMFMLKSMGCDLVQGYYFSRPVAPADFEPFIRARMDADNEDPEEKLSSYSIRRQGRVAEQERFTYEALHDPLTGLYNGSACKMLLKDTDNGHIALLLAAIDDYSQISRDYGKDVADRVLVRVADVLRQSFRSVDFICRIGSSEFAVIMTRVNSSMRSLVFDKIGQANQALLNPEGDLPPVSISVGAAFSDRENPKGSLFEDADTALYRMKEVRLCGCTVF